MAKEINREFAASPEALWEILGTPDRVDWVPGVESCSFDGEVRSLVLPGAGAIKERILKHDDETRTLEYSCFESPGGLESHHARVQVMASEVGCRLVWQASVIPASIEPFIEEVCAGVLSA